MKIETKASQSKIFNFGVSSSFSRDNKALKLVIPGHLLGDVVIITPSSNE